jgi:glutaminyl-tRNA synthetase
VTRFPPEPNGHLHIGHAKSICLNFGIAAEYGGRCHLRFDDTNPTKEEQEYIDAIQRDVRWLGFDWGEHLYHASDYFEQLYQWALVLIRDGLAYVDDQSADQIRETRGTLTEPGRPSPWRDRMVDDNLDLFARMRAGEFPDGARVLRARIDMASPNINLRDPVLYRIVHASHPRTGDAWTIYPTYDFAHGQSDAIEGVTHSICTLEFENHRPLYDWLIEHLPVPSRPHQYEFARLNLTWTVLSKRFLLRLVEDGRVRGWDDPRMPTIAGLRRRGFPAEAIRRFATDVGVSKRDAVIEIEQLEHVVRDVLNARAMRRFAVLRPLKVVIEDYPADQVELLEAVNNPEDPGAGVRQIPFSRELWIERDDFMEEPPPKYFRLAPGREVRLRYGYFITCREVVKDAAGDVIELRCTYDPATRGGDAPDGRRPRATIHWLSAGHALAAEMRLYERLFKRPDPGADGDLLADLDPWSETILTGSFVEPSVADAAVGEGLQFERLGYFTADPDARPGHLVFDRTLGLKDSWAKAQARGG